MVDQDAFYREVGKRIRRARRDRKMTQEELGTAISLTRTSVTNIERGRQKLLLYTLARIADALGIAAAALLPENDAELDTALDRALRDRPEEERDWIRTIVRSAGRQET